MTDKDLKKHAREFKGYLDNHQYDVTDEGILFPRAGAVASGEYFFDTDGERSGTQHNLLPTQALNYLLSAGLGGGTTANAWYLTIFTNSITPTDSITASNFAATAGELVSGAEGYAETTRPAWTPAAAAEGAMDNTAARAAFTIATATSVTIRGAALLSDFVKGGTNGVIMSIARFTQPRTEYAGNIFNLGYRVRLRPE